MAKERHADAAPRKPKGDPLDELRRRVTLLEGDVVLLAGTPGRPPRGGGTYFFHV